MGLEDMGARKILNCYNYGIIININLSAFRICKNGPSIINTRSNIKSNLYFCKTIFRDYFILIINIVITEKLLFRILNLVHQHLKKKRFPKQFTVNEKGGS